MQIGKLEMNFTSAWGYRVQRDPKMMHVNEYRYLLKIEDHSSGIYLYRVERNGVRVARKMVLVK